MDSTFGAEEIAIYEIENCSAADAGTTVYELLRPDDRSDFAPTLLMTCNVEDASFEALSSDGEHLARSVYSKTAEYGSASPETYAVMLVGVSLSPSVTAAEIEEFDDFYTTVHLPEVVNLRGYHRGVRYELQPSQDQGSTSMTPHLAVYEATEAATHLILSSTETPSFSAGPSAWDTMSNPWILWYRRVAR